MAIAIAIGAPEPATGSVGGPAAVSGSSSRASPPPSSRAVRVSAAGAGPGSSGTMPQRIALAAPGSASSAASPGDGIAVAIAGRLRPPAASSRARIGRSACTAAPWTNSALPAPAPAGSSAGVRSQTRNPSASTNGSPHSAAGIGRRVAFAAMILYGCAVTDDEIFAHQAEAGVAPGHLRRPRSELIAQPSTGSIARNYNLLRERVADRDELEALVLIHQDVEIVDPGFSSEVREALADPEVAVVGCRRRRRRAQPRLVGGGDHLGVADPALLRVRGRRRDPGDLLEHRRAPPTRARARSTRSTAA